MNHEKTKESDFILASQSWLAPGLLIVLFISGIVVGLITDSIYWAAAMLYAGAAIIQYYGFRVDKRSGHIRSLWRITAAEAFFAFFLWLTYTGNNPMFHGLQEYPVLPSPALIALEAPLIVMVAVGIVLAQAIRKGSRRRQISRR